MGWIYLAKDLEFGEAEFDETEELQVKKIPLADAVELVLSGQITDSLSIAGLLKVARLLGL